MVVLGGGTDEGDEEDKQVREAAQLLLCNESTTLLNDLAFGCCL